MSEEQARSQVDPQTHLAPELEPETAADERGPDGPAVPDADREVDPAAAAHGSGPAGPQQENAETSLDQPSEDVE